MGPRDQRGEKKERLTMYVVAKEDQKHERDYRHLGGQNYREIERSEKAKRLRRAGKRRAGSPIRLRRRAVGMTTYCYIDTRRSGALLCGTLFWGRTISRL